MQLSYSCLALLLLTACGRLGFGVGTGGTDGAPSTDGARDGGAGTTDGPVADAPADASLELCNGLDDDDDGLVDEGIDLQTDRTNCGACGNFCVIAQATPRCVAGVCTAGACDDGWGDCNDVGTDGCEQNLSTSAAHCGRCARACGTGVGCFERHCATDVVSLAVGAEFSCGLAVAGELSCWGSNASGQLGDGTNVDHLRAAPTLVTGAKHVAAGTLHACAATAAGSVLCWGGNAAGQLGDGTTTASNTPVTALVGGVTAARHVAAGRAHSCAALMDGTIWCWGENLSGQLGDGTRIDRITPVLVVGAVAATSVAAGDSHTCAMIGDGVVVCWGSNSDGQLGNGTTTDSLSPVATGLAGEQHIEVGAFHGCAHGSAWCWGRNTDGQLGNGMLVSSSIPVGVLVGEHANVAAGDAHSCVLLPTGGAVACTGSNASGQLGDGTTTSASTPVAVSGVSSTIHVAAGAAHTCAVNHFGIVRCWGSNTGGQLGDNTRTNRPTAVRVLGLP